MQEHLLSLNTTLKPILSSYSVVWNLKNFKIYNDKRNPPYRSRGFGFAKFTTEKSAFAAFERFNSMDSLIKVESCQSKFQNKISAKILTYKV